MAKLLDRLLLAVVVAALFHAEPLPWTRFDQSRRPANIVGELSLLSWTDAGHREAGLRLDLQSEVIPQYVKPVIQGRASCFSVWSIPTRNANAPSDVASNAEDRDIDIIRGGSSKVLDMKSIGPMFRRQDQGYP